MKLRRNIIDYGLLLVTLLVLAGSAAAQEITPEATSTPLPLPTEGALYVPMTFPAAVDSTTYTNPFDSEDIELLGIFQSPSGQQVVVPGFWMQPYENRCASTCESENLQSTGDPTWQVRFTPQEVGRWTVTLQTRDGDRILGVQEGAFEVTETDEPGFIRVGANRRYFQYQDGEPYFPIGHNLKWSWDEAGGLATYEDWLRQLSASGGNYARLFIDVPWFIGFEWEAVTGDYRGEAQRAAARLDAILTTAAETGVQLQLVLLWHQALNLYNGPPVVVPDTFDRPDMNADWDNNPYNLIYGGPLGGPGFFFSNETARDLFRRRLRYIVARWGYSPAIFAWEIVDEIDRTSSYESQTAAAWLQDAASYLKQIDQHGHLVTAGTENYDALIASNALLDFTTGQFYQRRPIETVGDQVVGIVDTIRRNLGANPVPTLLTAYSLNPWFEPTEEDPTGIHVQDSLWAAALSGSAGGAASDWWDTYVIPQGLQQYYAPLAAFAAGVDWPNLNLQPAEAALVTQDYSAYQPVRLTGYNRLFSAAALDVVPRTITADGASPTLENLPSYLYGQVYSSQLSQAQVYRVTLPVESYLEIGVARVSTQAGARLSVLVDNQSAANLELSTGSHDLAVRVPLPAGDHEITLDNLGDDWLELAYIEVGLLRAPARVLTLRDAAAGVALAWLQHRDYDWEKAAAGVVPQPVTFEYRLEAMPPGWYRVELWEPLSGAVIGEENVRVDVDGRLRVNLLPLENQLALRAFRVAELGVTAEPVTVTSAPASTPPPAPTQAAEIVPLVVQTNTPRP